MLKRQVRIISTGVYLPKNKVDAAALDQRLGLAPGTSVSLSGVQTRYFTDQTKLNSDMAAAACNEALKNAGLTFKDIDVLISTSGSYEQGLPCEAALIQKKLGASESGMACFDVDSTCLSFVTAFDLISWPMHAGQYKRVMIVASEMSTMALNWKHLESATLFGDGAAAVILESSSGTESNVFASRMETYSSGFEYCQVEGGGSRIHPRHSKGETDERFLFSMDGRAVFKEASKRMPAFLEKFLESAQIQISDFDLVIPHQASVSAVELMRRRLDIPSEKMFVTVQDYGNMIAASIPFSLHLAIQQNKMKRKDKVLLIGTSAGLSLGALGFEY